MTSPINVVFTSNQDRWAALTPTSFRSVLGHPSSHPNQSRTLLSRPRSLPNHSTTVLSDLTPTSNPFYLGPKRLPASPKPLTVTSKPLNLGTPPLSGQFQTTGPRSPSPSRSVPNHFRVLPNHSTSHPLPCHVSSKPFAITSKRFELAPSSSRAQSHAETPTLFPRDTSPLSPVRTLSFRTPMRRASAWAHSE
jgi:hypothetical protein